MTEKRFKYIRTKYRHYIQDIEKDGEYIKGKRGTYGDFDLDKLTDLLNDLHEEKEISIDVIKIADELIKKYGSDRLKHEWKKEVIIKYR